MLILSQFAPEGSEATETLTLGFDQRQRSRLRANLDSGAEVGIVLPRGSHLHEGDCLSEEGGLVVRVHAAVEETSVVRSTDARLFARACYHLGNRHVPLQIGEGELRYLHDHVLDAMVEGLGLTVTTEASAFEPEPGAYAAGEHGHHDHAH